MGSNMRHLSADGTGVIGCSEPACASCVLAAGASVELPLSRGWVNLPVVWCSAPWRSTTTTLTWKEMASGLPSTPLTAQLRRLRGLLVLGSTFARPRTPSCPSPGGCERDNRVLITDLPHLDAGAYVCELQGGAPGALSADVFCRFDEGLRTDEGMVLEAYWQLRNDVFDPDASVGPEPPAR